jgi:hypothetical protein
MQQQTRAWTMTASLISFCFILAKQNHQDLVLAKRSHRDEFVNVFRVLCAICPAILPPRPRAGWAFYKNLAERSHHLKFISIFIGISDLAGDILPPRRPTQSAVSAQETRPRALKKWKLKD